ncbi:MAG: hypothetical protein SF182_19120 [Deltaproteobacteria bacterium]|nr:hypothetical protein [Deltaproteobacteria bacterium]
MTIRAIALLVSLCSVTGCSLIAPTDPPRSRPTGKPAVISPKPPSAPPAARVGLPQLGLGAASGAAGQTVTVSATLRTGSVALAGTQNDIEFDPGQIAIAAKPNGKPDCAANPALGKEGTAFSFLPAGCQKGGTCSSVRALVLSLSNVDPIPDGAVLYTCRVRIAAGAAPGAHPLSIMRVGFSSPNGQAVHGAGENGRVMVQ